MSFLIILSLVAALGVGIYVGLGMPGMPGREDRVVSQGRARRLPTRHLDWLRPRKH
ncbi:MAG TPA: hypothetical protein VMM79_13500 [Longimicrobiales bacterium]|nr:hypothetical protein [Longimicrobiales bacterium]